MSKHRTGHYFSGLIAGVLIGAGIYHYLTTTSEGQKVKKKIQEKGQQTLDHLLELVKDFEVKGKEFKQTVDRLQVDLENKVKESDLTQKKVVQDQLAKVKQIRDRGRQATKKFFQKNGKSLG